MLNTLLPYAEAQIDKSMNYQCDPQYCPFSQLCKEFGENEIQFDNPKQFIESILSIMKSLEVDDSVK